MVEDIISLFLKYLFEALKMATYRFSENAKYKYLTNNLAILSNNFISFLV